MNTTELYTRHYEIWPEIAELRRQGLYHWQIAAKLYLSRSTVSLHCKLANKLGHGEPRARHESPLRLGIESGARRLGRLCKRGHDYQGTGQSLRDYAYNCIECKCLLAKQAKLRKKESANNVEFDAVANHSPSVK